MLKCNMFNRLLNNNSNSLLSFISRESFLFIVLLFVIIFSCFTIKNFVNVLTIKFLLIQLIPILLIALPMTLVIISGEIDLSVASTAGLTSAVMGVLWRDSGLNMETIIIFCLIVGVLAGAFNGLLITVLGLPSLAVTIGTLALYRGIALVVIGDEKVSNFPPNWSAFVTSTIGSTGIPTVILGVMFLILFFVWLLHFTSFGRSLFALGYNNEAAKFVGIKVLKVKFWLFIGTGLVSSIAGIFWTLRFASAGPDNATGIELSVIAAVLLGGVSIFGGKGSILGVVCAALLIGTLTYSLRLAKIPETTLVIVTGLLLVFSVVAPSFFKWIKFKVST